MEDEPLHKDFGMAEVESIESCGFYTLVKRETLLEHSKSDVVIFKVTVWPNFISYDTVNQHSVPGIQTLKSGVLKDLILKQWRFYCATQSAKPSGKLQFQVYQHRDSTKKMILQWKERLSILFGEKKIFFSFFFSFSFFWVAASFTFWSVHFGSCREIALAGHAEMQASQLWVCL